MQMNEKDPSLTGESLENLEPVSDLQISSQDDSSASDVSSTEEDTAGFDPSKLAEEINSQADDDITDIVEPDPPLPDFTFEQA